jgi:hypothetical protein
VCVLALLPGLVAAADGDAACLLLASHPDGARLARIALPADEPTFTVTYVHSVTRTPVVERYRADGDTIVESEIRFVQHGPGLPTEADAGGTFTRRDGEFVVSMQRRFAVIVMRVHADQAPRLAAGGRSDDLAAWGNRALAVRSSADACAAH